MENVNQLVEEWYKRVSVTQVAHYQSADYFGRRKYLLGVPAIILAAFAGTSIFATLAQQPNFYLQLAIGFASVGTAVLASLQTFMGYSERAEKHRLAGAKYGALGRKLESMIVQPTTITNEELVRVREKLDALAEESPNNPLRIYKGAGAAALEKSAARLSK